MLTFSSSNQNTHSIRSQNPECLCKQNLVKEKKIKFNFGTICQFGCGMMTVSADCEQIMRNHFVASSSSNESTMNLGQRESPDFIIPYRCDT